MAQSRGRWPFAGWLQPQAENPRATPATEREQGPPARGHEQRRFPRIRVTSSLHGYSVDLDVSITIRDVSQGGFSLEGPVPYQVGAEQTFLFTSGDGVETLVRCQCRHSRMTTSAAGVALYVAGFEFLPQPEDNLKLIVETIERLMKIRPDLQAS